jgi:hypothetical protein
MASMLDKTKNMHELIQKKNRYTYTYVSQSSSKPGAYIPGVTENVGTYSALLFSFDMK